MGGGLCLFRNGGIRVLSEDEGIFVSRRARHIDQDVSSHDDMEAFLIAANRCDDVM